MDKNMDKNMDKMNGLKYLCNIASRGQTIYVYDISRFSRNTREALNLLENLKEKGVSLFSVTEELGYNSVASRNQFRLQLCANISLSFFNFLIKSTKFFLKTSWN